MEKLDNLQLQLNNLSQRLKTALEPSIYDEVSKYLQDIQASYKPKKEALRLAKVYFLYNHKEPDELEKYSFLCKRALLRDKS